MIDPQSLLRAVDASPRRPLGVRELAAAAGYRPGELTEVKRALRELVRTGVLVKEGKRYAKPGSEAAAFEPVPAEAPTAPPRRGSGGAPVRGAARDPAVRPGSAAAKRGIVGRLLLRPEGYGFVTRLEGEGDDIFLPPNEARGCLDGDKIRVAIVPGRYGRDAGQLIEILGHRRRHLVGTLQVRGGERFVVPADPSLPQLVPVTGGAGARPGQVVKVAITSYPEEAGGISGEIEKVVGEPGDPLVEVLAVAYKSGFSESFPEEVVDEAERIPDHVTAEQRAGRRDLTSLRLITIDGEDARDFDDAVHVERRGRGYRLVVAIADVAEYVKPGTLLDQEALGRATSVYFPNHVLPMLPERLSNGICSLNPGVDRLCMVCDLVLDEDGRPLSADLYQGVMRSRVRSTYTQVAAQLGGEQVPALTEVAEDVRLAGQLARKLRERRVERGTIDFDLPEAKVVLDAKMQPVDVVKRERNEAHRLVEEFMLAANEAVARYFAHRDLPTVYRVHATPDLTKLEIFATFARGQGFTLDVTKGLGSKALNDFLIQLERSQSTHKQALNSLLLRAMMQAVYSPSNIGHYGLAAEHYLHFTSPIRRYPDLMVHRLLKELWARGGEVPGGKAREELETQLEQVALQSSERERAAMLAERDIEAFFKCLYVQDRVGERFGATILAVTDFGFFAELDSHAVEGLVKAEELGTAYELDATQHRLVFGSGLSFGIGDRVKVEIAAVSTARRQIDLVLVEDQEGLVILPSPWRPDGAGEQGRGRGGARAAAPSGLKQALDRARTERGGGGAASGGRGGASGGRGAGGGRGGGASGGRGGKSAGGGGDRGGSPGGAGKRAGKTGGGGKPGGGGKGGGRGGKSKRR